MWTCHAPFLVPCGKCRHGTPMRSYKMREDRRSLWRCELRSFWVNKKASAIFLVDSENFASGWIPNILVSSPVLWPWARTWKHGVSAIFWGQKKPKSHRRWQDWPESCAWLGKDFDKQAGAYFLNFQASKSFARMGRWLAHFFLATFRWPSMVTVAGPIPQLIRYRHPWCAWRPAFASWI